eukprot:1141410-Pelagomonas_calceolata.AAC.1
MCQGWCSYEQVLTQKSDFCGWTVPFEVQLFLKSVRQIFTCGSSEQLVHALLTSQLISFCANWGRSPLGEHAGHPKMNVEGGAVAALRYKSVNHRIYVFPSCRIIPFMCGIFFHLATPSSRNAVTCSYELTPKRRPIGNLITSHGQALELGAARTPLDPH